MWDTISGYFSYVTTILALLDLVLIFVTVPWILAIKKETTSALAWILLVVFLPLVGAIAFLLLGYQNVHRPLRRKIRHRQAYRVKYAGGRWDWSAEDREIDPDATWEGMGRLAHKLDAYPLSNRNQIEFYHDGPPAFERMFEDMRQAKHHIHVQYYIFNYDELGRKFLDLLVEKAREGVEVRLLYDAMGSRQLGAWRLRKLRQAGGKFDAFLPVRLLRRRFQVNLRNHRKILITDGLVAYTGGLNVGDEYIGKDPDLSPWRDTHMRIEGPAVESLQSVFAEDWNFAYEENLDDDVYYPDPRVTGNDTMQVIRSGPDQEVKSIREIYLAAVFKARSRLWITTPYYVPDSGLQDALRLAARTGIDVRLLIPHHADHEAVHFATQYYLPDLMEAGVKVYEYTEGFIHSKVWLVDGQWASVGTANVDMRSLVLNFEVNCLIYTPRIVEELEMQFLEDLKHSIALDAKVFARRPLSQRLMANICRLFSPVL